MNQFIIDAQNRSSDIKEKYNNIERKIYATLLALFVSLSDTNYKLRMVKWERQNLDSLLTELQKGAWEWCSKILATVFISGVLQADLDMNTDAEDNELAKEYDTASFAIASEAYERLTSVEDSIRKQVNEFFAALTIVFLQGKMFNARTERFTMASKSLFIQKNIENLKNKLLKNGLIGFTDRAGKRWMVDTYVTTVLDNNIIQAYRKGYVMRMIERGQDLVRVVGGVHENSCDACVDVAVNYPVLSVTGATVGYKTVAEAEQEGLSHVNCVHYYEFITKEEADYIKRQTA